MEFARQEEKLVNEVCNTEGNEIVQLPDIQLAMVGGGVADVTLS